MRHSLTVRTLLAAAAVLGFLACTSTANPAGVQQDPVTGAHPANWLLVHWSAYIQDPNQCSPCHGSALTQEAATPQSGVSCFGCHHPSGPNHPSGWGQGVIPPHGTAAIAAAAPAFDPNNPVFPMQGFASCTPCHGNLYNNPNNTAAVSCYSCHTTAPHPPKPWGAGLGLPNTQPRHDLVDLSEASECAKCHTLGANSDIKPVPAAPNGTVPGCFNGTLCHTTNPQAGA